jgi:hypothetical protein
LPPALNPLIGYDPGDNRSQYYGQSTPKRTWFQDEISHEHGNSHEDSNPDRKPNTHPDIVGRDFEFAHKNLT